MSIVFMILKILGITLLAIILLVLLVLAALLFCAFKYEITADGDKDGPEVHALVKVRWLFRIVSFQYLFDKTPDGAEDKNGYILRVFGIPVKKAINKPGDEDHADDGESSDGGSDSGETAGQGDNDSDEKPDSGGETAGNEPESSSATDVKSGGETSKPEDSAKPGEETSKPEDGVKPGETSKPEGKTDGTEESGGNGDESTETADSESAEASNEESGEKPKGKLAAKIKGIKDKISKKVTDLLESFEALLILLQKKKGLLEKYITKKSTKKAVKKAWKVLVWVLKHICPKKYSGSLTFGLDDPSLTGEICAAISPWYILIADKFTVTPSFEGKLTAGGNVYLKGRIRLWGFLTRAISLYRDKNIRKVVDEAKKVKETIMETPDEAKEIFAGAA
ncbi:MAG: hypothetical protein IJL03_04170 [Lachnospiraceae bacterium]|nr:hypothetical protein [Lachnospiraceae bacterium]